MNKLGREGWLFSFSKTQGSRLLTTLKESIEEIPMLRERLYPGSTDGWAETKIRCKNGTKVIVGSAGESVRGAHPGWIVVDDFLKDNVLYSEEQRKKFRHYWNKFRLIKTISGEIKFLSKLMNIKSLYSPR